MSYVHFKTGNNTQHTKDSDCILDKDNVCKVCGVYHGEACPECQQRGFHLSTCPLCEADCNSCVWSYGECNNGSMYIPCMPIYTESSCENFRLAVDRT